MNQDNILLQANNLTKRFGGLAANQGVNLILERGKVHALLGPNGAGKSTCINMLSGDLLPTEGTILYRGIDITRSSPAQRSKIGIGRSYQRTNIFFGSTVFENVRLAAQSRNQRAWRIFSNALSDKLVAEKTMAAIDEAGLHPHAGRIAGILSHGEQRQLEIAMVLATNAEVLLLDEPLAGMGSEESSKIVELLLRLRSSRAILLVEHDMDAIFSVSNVITVMVNGTVLESGSPDQIRSSDQVQQAYLGHEEMLHV